MTGIRSNVPGMFNFKWLRVAEMAHATTVARLIGRLVFSDTTWINFSRAEIYATIQAKLVAAFVKAFCHCVFGAVDVARRIMVTASP